MVCSFLALQATQTIPRPTPRKHAMRKKQNQQVAAATSCSSLSVERKGEGGADAVSGGKKSGGSKGGGSRRHRTSSSGSFSEDDVFVITEVHVHVVLQTNVCVCVSITNLAKLILKSNKLACHLVDVCSTLCGHIKSAHATNFILQTVGQNSTLQNVMHASRDIIKQVVLWLLYLNRQTVATLEKSLGRTG